MSVISSNDVIVCFGYLCCHDGCDFNPETCLGCAAQDDCLCCSSSFCLKTPCKPYSTCTLCHWCFFCCECSMFEKFTLCKCQQQCLCYVTAAALPTDDDVPCVCTLIIPSLMIYPKCGCCVKYSEIKSAKVGTSTNGAPEADVMSR
mmetsp:Transcript_24758/g.61406  ORF Transcript_24758/g.61406 Transcript_24758/m.61406 type:complete len:146 (-) Transcript_24758:525-962(-)